ncbi:cation:proton antiporter [Brachybacterium sp. EF45031]|uniref:cation:proton antiporter family protein n=1 Tax=Brachybacterium sillae TaxID=2810536 RepID=UPI00217EE16C|nr:cation:proton antiporter family protein [Brachybacterium sillae]MCS6710858.1 cation:proton antiporter [Brachybacterium sillae]
MDVLVVPVLAAFGLGALAHLVRLPPLIGYLAAGFALSIAGVAAPPGLEVMAEVGVALMLFTIGLHLDLRTLLRPQVWLTATAHMLAVTVLSALGLAGLAAATLLAPASWRDVAVIGLLLSFSSTILALKILQDRGDTSSLYGRIAIGILLIQDIAAVVIISVSTGHPPRPWALALVAVIPLLVWATRHWPHLGDGDLGVLFGVLMALVPGYALFTWLGLSGELGALVMGVILARHDGADKLARTVASVRELLLVGFFVNIGYLGLPDLANVREGLLMLLLLPMQGVGYWLLLMWLGMRHRTAVLASLTLTNFSEFALIVAALGVDDGTLDAHWLNSLVIAVAASFVLSGLLNPLSVGLATRISSWLGPRPVERLHPEERPLDLGDARTIVLGMGRVGRVAAQRLETEYGIPVLGVEQDPQRVEVLREQGVRVIEGDATDADFWARVREDDDIEAIILALPSQHANLEALRRLRAAGSDRDDRQIAAIAQYREDVAELHNHGLRTVVHLYAGAGAALADAVAEAEDLPGSGRGHA